MGDLDESDGVRTYDAVPSDEGRLWDTQWLTDRIRELELEAENRDESLAMIAHELRTPLTVLQGGIWLMRNRGDDQDEASREELLAMLDHQASFLSLALMNMLTLARVRSGELPELEPVVLREEVRAGVDAFRAMAQGRVVRVSIPKNLPPVLAHPSYVQEILVNLLVNADRYSPETATVAVNAEDDNSEVKLHVTDEGEGLPESELDAIFDRFFQSSRRTGSGSGTGTGTVLGLTVCRRLVDAMGGRIWAENAKGAGLRVTFTLSPCP
jgi:two-component system, OmpR family, sensor histidine kinase KdpD